MWVVVFLWAWGGAAGSPGDVRGLSQGVRSELAGLLDEVGEVRYSRPVLNTSYVASVQFDMRAMGMLYNSTHAVIDAISKKQAYPEGIVSTSGGYLEIKPLREEWRPLLAHYVGPTAIVVTAVLLAAALPLAGLFWCCCYWCRAGRRRRPFDRKYDACLKGFLAIVLIALLTLFLFGVVCAFATDSQLEASGADAAPAARAGLRDAREFLNATQAHARWLLVTNYRELEAALNLMLRNIGLKASWKLGEFSNAVSVGRLARLVAQLDGAQAQLRDVRNLTAQLRLSAERLNFGLRQVKTQLLRTLSNCHKRECDALKEKYKIGQLDTEIQYSQLPDVTDLLNNVTALLNSDLKQEVHEGSQVVNRIQLDIKRSVDEHIPSVQRAISDAGRKLERVAEQISQLAGNWSAALARQGAAADSLAALHARYGPYRRYAGLGAAAALLLITCLLAWGLLCGVCGKRPDAYGASDCCNKGAGSKSLLCGMGAMFVAGGAACAVLAAYFAAALAAQRFFCDPLTEPRDNRLFADLESLVNLEEELFNERRDPDFNMTYVLVHCHQNRTAYETLQLHRLHDVERTRAAVSVELGARVAALRPAYPARRVRLLRDHAKARLRQFADSGLSDFDFDKILYALETNLTSLALDSLARQLDSTARSLAQPAFEREARDLRAASAALSQLIDSVLEPMLRQAASLNRTAIALRDELRLNQTSLREAISYLMHETNEAEHFLNTQGPETLQNITQDFANVIATKFDEYLDHVVYAMKNEVGRCGPLSNAFNATRDAACKKILMPANGYWMSLAWCVVLLVPLMAVAQRLARLYLHVDPYPGPLVEAEYLYDAYADRDNVPLANAYKAEKRSGRGRAREGEARGAGAGGGAGGGAGAGAGAGAGGARPDPAVAAPLDAYHARRYNDMAPKHWEEGPPRYLGPTEYERPPPYYYPGPDDRQ